MRRLDAARGVLVAVILSVIGWVVVILAIALI